MLPETRRWLVARALASVGGALFVVGAWVPWLAMDLRFDRDGPTWHQQVNGGGGLLGFLQLVGYVGLNLPTRLLYLLSFTWGAVTLLGVLLCPLLWQRLSPRGTRLAIAAYSGWVVFATIAATVAANALMRLVSGARGPFAPRVVGWHADRGFWLAALGLLCAWAAATMLQGEPRRSMGMRRATPGSVAPRTRPQLAGAGVLSVGALAWGVGFVALPWAMTRCASVSLSLNHYTNGSCAALDAGDALATTFINHVPLAATTATTTPDTYALLAYGLLTGGALLVVAGAWRRAPTRALCAWLTTWFALADGAVLVALRGVVIIRRTAPILSSDSAGAWAVGPGVFVCLVGLLLVACGLAALWWQSLGRARQPAIEVGL